MTGGLVTVFGGSGFAGRYIVRSLARAGYRVRVAIRRPKQAYFLQPFGDVGQITSVQANLRDTESVARACEGADIVINCVGVLYESGSQDFSTIHVDGAARVAWGARHAGVKQLIHISALGADAGSSAEYSRSKAAGEAGVSEAFPKAVILRPSVIFGPEDNFFNLFAAMARISPILPLIGGGNTKFQPVFAGDVAAAVMQIIGSKASKGGIFELGGPDIMSFREILEFILKATDRKRLLVPLPFFMAKMEAFFLQMWPWPLLTVDQVRLLETDNIVSKSAISEGRTLDGLGVKTRSVEAMVPAYLKRYRPAGQFDSDRKIVLD